jgi:hypothetical protein
VGMGPQRDPSVDAATLSTIQNEASKVLALINGGGAAAGRSPPGVENQNLRTQIASLEGKEITDEPLV